MKWEKVKLSEVTEYITDGDHQPAPKSDSGVLFVKIKDIQDNRLTFDNALFVPQEYYNRLPKNRKAEYGDTLYTVVGSYGIPAFVNHNIPFCFERNIALLHPNNRVIPKYLYYAVKNPIFYGNANNIANGSAQKLIPLSKLAGMEISVPPIERQETIVNILSAYDDLIENNQKQIKLLEEAAQRLYKEWFVDLRFPGHENVKIVDGVPEGWEKCLLSDIIGYEIGGGWGEEKPTEKCDIPAYVIRGTDLYGVTHGDSVDIPYRFHEKKNLDARRLADGDIIFEVSGGSKTEGVARTALIRSAMLEQWSEPAMCASFCKLIRVREPKYAQLLFNTFQYMRASGKTTEYDKRSASSIVNYRWKDFLATETVLIPDEVMLEKYNALANNMYQLIVQKSISIEKAKGARDRLLPKLVSGELEV